MLDKGLNVGMSLVMLFLVNLGLFTFKLIFFFSQFSLFSSAFFSGLLTDKSLISRLFALLVFLTCALLKYVWKVFARSLLLLALELLLLVIAFFEKKFLLRSLRFSEISSLRWLLNSGFSSRIPLFFRAS